MTKFKTIFTIFSIIAIHFSSCTLEKRHYRPGFYIQKKGHLPLSVKPNSAKTDIISENSIPIPKTDSMSILSDSQQKSVEIKITKDPSPDKETNHPCFKGNDNTKATNESKRTINMIENTSKTELKEFPVNIYSQNNYSLDKGDSGGSKKGIIAIIIGLLFLVLAWLLSGLGVFGVILAIIFLIAGGIYIVIGIISIIF
ncbi:MAG TPA: hypothetical protein PK637_00360 [Flavobacteriales bacterium]|nr:hypothetical protein [Flavobacteriales bacterium]HRJ38628.1 hypothetical protein [Flavobacteriales bacterium]